jgi:LPS-assembly lipoprotein
MLNRRMMLQCMLALPVAGCGFRPLYGQKGSGGDAVDLSAVTVIGQANRAGQLVRNELLKAMTGATERYILKLTVTEKERAKSTLSGTQTARYELTLNGSYVLTDAQAGGTVSKGASFSTVAYDVVRQPIADTQARDNAVERAAIELASDIRLRVAVYLSSSKSG